MYQGKIIEYIDQGRFICTLCLQDKGNRLHLLTPSNREINFSPKRALLISGGTTDTLRPREELLEMLKATEETRNRLRVQVDVRDLWELVRDEKESFDHRYLAQLVFGETITDDHYSALVRSLLEDHLYFKMKDGRFLPHSEERVEQIVLQREEEASKEERLKQGTTWLIDIQQGKKPDDPPCKEDVIQLLIQLALYGNEAPDLKYGKELLSHSGVSDIRQSRRLLITLGVWEEHENIDLLRSAISTSFTEQQLQESARLANRRPNFKGREDLRHLPTLTIDGPLTRDYDDAVSLQVLGDTLHLGIHIADVAATILPESILDQEAAERALSLYLPRRHIPMIPPDLSQDSLSLTQGHDREALSLLTRLDRNGELLDYRFVPSMIRVARQLTYDEANERLHTEGVLGEMHHISERLRQKRLEQGALSLSLPDVEVKFNADSSLILELVSQNTPSRMIIAEIMILYNCLAARFCRDNQIPTLYRAQEKPSEHLSIDEEGYTYYVFQQRRKLSPLKIATAPNPHSGLGLDAYIHATSPLRRYLDLVVQRQMSSFLKGMGPIYDEKRLEEIRISVGPVIRDLERIKRNSLRYWILQYLSEHLGGKYKALILDELKTKYRIVLPEFLLLAEMKRQDGVILNRGQEILVEVKKSDPRDDLLDLAYAGYTAQRIK
jgi:exoribonuclease-2